MSTSGFTHLLAVDLPSLTSSDRFVDQDMFMRYRGGGVGHTYMRDIEVKYENMSIKRNHWKSRSKPPQGNSMDIDDEQPENATQLGTSEDKEDQGTDKDGDESDDGDDDGLDNGDNGSLGGRDDNGLDGRDDNGLDGGCSTGCDEDSDDNELGDFEENSDDELGSDAGYESYGLADP